MLFHRARLAGALVASRLLDEDFEDPKDFALGGDDTIPIQGPGLQGYYDSLRGQLQGETKKKVERNTYLVLNDDESISVLLHATDILVIQPDNTLEISFGDDDYKTVTTVNRMNMFLPSGFSISRTYKRGGRSGGTYRDNYGTSGEPYYSSVADEQTFWNVSGMQSDPSYTVIQPAETGDVVQPSGLLVPTEPPIIKKNRRRKRPDAGPPDYIPPAG